MEIWKGVQQGIKSGLSAAAEKPEEPARPSRDGASAPSAMSQRLALVTDPLATGWRGVFPPQYFA